MIRNTDALKTLRNSAFVHNHSSSPSWPALAQGFRRAKKPGRWPRGSSDAVVVRHSLSVMSRVGYRSQFNQYGTGIGT